MTQEQKAKAYDEALEKAKEIKEKIVYSHLSTESCKAVSEYIDTIIPELAESEDERMRRKLMDHLDWHSDNRLTHEECVQLRAWLENQKEIPVPNSTELIEMWDKEKAMLKEKDFRGDEWRLAYNAFMDGFAEGVMVKQKPAEWSEKQMLKEAVEGRIRSFGFHNAIYIKEPKWTEKLDKFKDGDEILVIVLPKEDQTNG